VGPAISVAVLKNAPLITNNDGTTSFVPNESIFLAALVAAVVLALFLLLKKFVKQKAEVQNG